MKVKSTEPSAPPYYVCKFVMEWTTDVIVSWNLMEHELRHAQRVPGLSGKKSIWKYECKIF